MPHNRRSFLLYATAGLATASTSSLFAGADQPIMLTVETGEELQQELYRHRGSRHVLMLARGSIITCPVRQDIVEGEVSSHPLLIPEGVSLDLNGATLLLDCQSNSYGVRLSNNSAIRNGTIKVMASTNKGSQGCWHSCVSVGAAYGDGGTTAKPGYFSTVKNWVMEDLTLHQPFPASVVQLMSEACYGVIRNIRILDSNQALLGIGMDWGAVGPMTSEDKEIPRMRTLYEQGLIYSTHPHDILIENIRVGKLTRNIDANDAGVRCSGCHNITIRNVEISEAATAVAIWGGDLGYEFAREDQRAAAHQKYLIEDVKIDKALRFGLVLNGASDNVWRATLSQNYKTLRDPVFPGLNQPVIRRVQLNGPGADKSAQGIYAVSLTQGRLEDVRLAYFQIGAHVEDWVDGMTFQRTTFAGNQTDKLIEGATTPAKGVEFLDDRGSK